MEDQLDTCMEEFLEELKDLVTKHKALPGYELREMLSEAGLRLRCQPNWLQQ